MVIILWSYVEIGFHFDIKESFQVISCQKKWTYINHDSIYKSNKKGKNPMGWIYFIGTVGI